MMRIAVVGLVLAATMSGYVGSAQALVVGSARAHVPGSVQARHARPIQEAGTPPALGIEEAVRLALEGNRELAAARLGARESSELVSEAWSVALPKVDLRASYTRNINASVNFLPARIFDSSASEDDYLAVRFGADNQWISTLSVEQALFRPALLGIGAAARFEDLGYESVRGQEQAVVTRVRLGYYGLLLAKERLRLTGESLARVRQSLEESEARLRAGLASEYDVLRLRVEEASLLPELERAENDVRAARRDLAVELDRHHSEEIDVLGSLANIDLESPGTNAADNLAILQFAGTDPHGSADDVVTRARALRSDVRQLEITEDLRRAELRIERMAYLPEVTLFGNYSVNAQDNGSPNFFARGDGQRAYSQFAGLSISVPVFTGLSRDARIDQKRALMRQAEELTRRAVDLADAEVVGLVESAREAHGRALAQKLAVKTAERAFEIVRAEYREGIADRLEVTDAEVALRQTEFGYAQAVFDYLVAQAQLDEAAGTVPLVGADPMGSRAR